MFSLTQFGMDNMQ